MKFEMGNSKTAFLFLGKMEDRRWEMGLFVNVKVNVNVS